MLPRPPGLKERAPQQQACTVASNTSAQERLVGSHMTQASSQRVGQHKLLQQESPFMTADVSSNVIAGTATQEVAKMLLRWCAMPLT